MKLTNLFILILIISIFAVSHVSAADINSTDVVLENDATFADLATLVENTNENATLTLNHNYKYEEGNSPITISKTITIDGRGYTLDASGKSSILTVNANNVTLRNINFINAKTAVYLNGNNDSIIDSTFINNSANSGGALRIKGANTLIMNTSFINNTGDSAGAIWIFDTHYNNIVNSTFINNRAVLMGGAICIDGTHNIISDCLFRNNHVEAYGAVVYVDGKNNTIKNSISINDTETDGESAVFVEETSTNTTITNCTFLPLINSFGKLQSIIDLAAKNSVIDLNRDYYFDEKEIIISKPLTINGNGFVLDALGMSRIFNITSDNVTLKNITLINGNASLGGAVYWSGNGGVLANSKLTNNTASGGGAVYWTGNRASVENTTFTLNNAVNAASLDILGGNASINSSKFISNNAVNGAGVVLNSDGSYIQNSEFTQNTADYGGGIIVNGVSNKLSNLTFTANTAKNASAILFSENATVNLNQITLNNNSMDEIVYGRDNKTMLFVSDLKKYYGGAERLNITLTDVKEKPLVNETLIISVNGRNYTRTTDNEGRVSMAINLPSGTYTATVLFKGNDDYLSISADVIISVYSTVNGTNLTKVFRNASQYYATFRDSTGKYLTDGSEVTFNINGVMYKRFISTNDGKARLNINLPQGEYILTAINPSTNEMCSNAITVIPTIVNNHDITKFYRNDTQYVIQLVGDDGKIVSQSQRVSFNINGVFYNRTSNASGHVKLNINLQPGDYIITAEYKNCKVSNKISVKPVLSANNLIMKYKDGSKFSARLVDGQGNVLANKNVTFNINGVFYNRLTDSEGIARLNINLMAGEYIITSSYNGANIANTITITV